MGVMVRRVFVAGSTGAVLLLASACGGGGGGHKASIDKAAREANIPAPQVTITPADGTGKARPDQGVQVTASGGQLQNVTVQAGSTTVTGQLSADRTSWKSDWTLTPNTDYTVTATAANPKAPSRVTTQTSKFHTLKPTDTLRITSVTPNSDTGKTVGVGMPILLDFNQDISTRAEKKAVEQALEVKSEQPAEGAWLWNGDNEVIFRTKDYWAPHQNITFTAHLAGVKVGSAYGMTDTTLKFKIGHSEISKVSTTSHRMKVYIDGNLVKNVGISAGRGGEYKYYTTSGVHLTMESVSPVTMTSPGLKPGDPGYYSETVYDAVRISNSGEYVHSAPWSVGDQGVDNVSHGCVNASPEFAKWFYDQSEWGDPVIITGTPRTLEWDNGYGFWQKSWEGWVAGSASKTSVQTGPTPTTDSPSTPPSTGTPSTSPSTGTSGSQTPAPSS
jgi:lipoprotein-anchoring transpeptidase ErfK/SrfK